MVDTSKASKFRDGLLDFAPCRIVHALALGRKLVGDAGQPNLPRLLFLLPLGQRAQNLILDAADKQHQAALLRVDGCELALRLPGKLLGPRFDPGAELLEWPREPLQGCALLFRLNALGRVGKVPLAAGGKLRVCDATGGEQGAILQRVNHGKGRDGRGASVAFQRRGLGQRHALAMFAARHTVRWPRLMRVRFHLRVRVLLRVGLDRVVEVGVDVLRGHHALVDVGWDGIVIGGPRKTFLLLPLRRFENDSKGFGSVEFLLRTPPARTDCSFRLRRIPWW